MMQASRERPRDPYPGEQQTAVGKRRRLLEYRFDVIPQFHSGLEVPQVVEQLQTILEMAKKENRHLLQNMCVVDGDFDQIHKQKILNQPDMVQTSQMATYCKEAASMHQWRSVLLKAAFHERLQFVNQKIRKLRQRHAAETAASMEKIQWLEEAQRVFETIGATHVFSQSQNSPVQSLILARSGQASSETSTRSAKAAAAGSGLGRISK